MSNTPPKHYLGDSIYIQDDDGMIVLTVDGGKDANGNMIIQSAVHMTPEVLCNFQRWLIKRKVGQIQK